MGTTGLAWLTSEALAISKAHRETIHSFQEAMTSQPCVGRSSSLRLQHLIADKRVTYKTYQILQQLFFEDFELFKKFISNSNQNDVSKSLFEKPEYPFLCKKYGETEIKYLINQYLA